MSAFTISEKTMQICLAIMAECPGVCKKYGYEPNDSQRLGDDLYTMNQEAIHQRYKEDVESIKFIAKPITIMGNFGEQGRVQLYKSLQCLHYQCNEGDVPESNKLYELLTECISDIAHAIVRKLPQYENAKWD